MTTAAGSLPGEAPDAHTTPVRLDVELVRRGLARSRGQADEMVRADRVVVDGKPAAKASRTVSRASTIEVAPGAHPDYVGRGALKLSTALDELAERGAAPVVSGRRALDAGASTGGFTEVLLERGAAEVLAVDVGQGQLAERLRGDPRVRDLSGTTVRGLTPSALGERVHLLVADLSFISLQVVMPDLVRLVEPGGDLLLLAKPQFEVGRERLANGGVVRDPALRRDAVLAVAEAGLETGLLVRDVVASRWPGPAGNVEYFVWLAAATDHADGLGDLAGDDVAEAVHRAVEEGPS